MFVTPIKRTAVLDDVNSLGLKLVQFADALPKSGSGKVMWRALQEAESVG